MTQETKIENKKNIKCGSIFIGILFSIIISIFLIIRNDTVGNSGILILTFSSVMFILNGIILFFTRKFKGKIKILVVIAINLLSVVVIFFAAAYGFAPTQLFYPNFDEEAFVELKDCDNAEELSVETNNGVISGWFWHNADDNAPLVLYFCGNKENSATRVLKNIKSTKIKKTFKGYNFAVFDYPGYGKSYGKPSEKSLQMMALNAFDYLSQRDDVDNSKIISMGYSMGTGAATYLASYRDVSGLIVMAPYADGFDLYNSFLNIFHGPLENLVSFKMTSTKFAENVSVTPLMIVSKTDKVVSYDSSIRLANSFSEGCSVKALEDTVHNQFWNTDEVLSYLYEYLTKGAA